MYCFNITAVARCTHSIFKRAGANRSLCWRSLIFLSLGRQLSKSIASRVLSALLFRGNQSGVERKGKGREVLDFFLFFSDTEKVETRMTPLRTRSSVPPLRCLFPQSRVYN